MAPIIFVVLLTVNRVLTSNSWLKLQVIIKALFSDN